MHVGDILRLFFEDNTVEHYRIISIRDDSIDIETSSGQETLSHVNGIVEKLGKKRIIGVEHIPQRDTQFIVGGMVRITFISGNVRAEVISNIDDILELKVNSKLIYIDLDNLPPNVRSIVPVGEELVEAEPVEQVEWIESPLQLHLIEHQLLSLYSAISTGDERSARIAKSLVRQFKLLHRSYTTETFEPTRAEPPLAFDRSDLMWLFPIIQKVYKPLFTEATALTGLLTSIQACLTTYTARGTEDRYRQYISCMDSVFTPATCTPGKFFPRLEARIDINATQPVKGGMEVIHYKRFIQTFADTSVAIKSYIMIPRAVPFSRVSLLETPLYEKSRLHVNVAQFYRVLRPWIRAATATPLTSAPSLITLAATTDSFSMHDAIRELEPYGYYPWHIPSSTKSILRLRIAARIKRYKEGIHKPKAAKSVSHLVHEPTYKLPPLFASERLAQMISLDGLRTRFKPAPSVEREVTIPILKTGYPNCLPDNCASDKTIRKSIQTNPTITLTDIPKPPKNTLERRRALQSALRVRYDVIIPERSIDALPERASALLSAYSALVSNGITPSSAPTLIAMLQSYGRTADSEEDKSWVYFRDDDIRGYKFIPIVVEELTRAYVEGVYDVTYASLLSSGRVAVEDGLLLDRGTGFVLSATDPKDVDEYENGFKIVHSAIVARDVAQPIYSVSDQPLLNITRALSDAVGVSLASYYEYIVSRVRGLIPSLIVPSIAALIVIFIERATGSTGWTLRVLKIMENMAIGMRKQSDTPTHKFWKAMPAKFAFAERVAELSGDFMIDRLVPIQSRGLKSQHTWPSFLPPKEFSIGNCVAPKSSKERVVRSKMSACASQIVGFVRNALRTEIKGSVEDMHLANTDIRMRIGVVNGLRQIIDPIQLRRPRGERREYISVAVPIPLGTDPSVIDVVPIFEEWGINGEGATVDMTKLGAQIRAYTNFVCDCTEQESVPDFIGNILGLWKGIVGIRDFLSEYINAISMTFPNMIIHGFAYFAGPKMEKSDGIMPLHMMSQVTQTHVSDVLNDVSKYYAALRVHSSEKATRVFASRARKTPVGETALLDSDPAVQFAHNYDSRRNEFQAVRAVAAVARFHPDVNVSVALLKYCIVFVLSRFLVGEDGDLDEESREYACTIVKGCLTVLRSDVARYNRSSIDISTSMRRSKIKESKRFNLRFTDEDRQTRMRRVFLSEQGLTEDARIGRTFKHSKVKEALEEAEFLRGIDSTGNAEMVAEINEEPWEEDDVEPEE